MSENSKVQSIRGKGRVIESAQTGDPALGPLALLPGHWRSLPGRGWNMIALPFEGSPIGYRLLLNQYNEELKFKLVDKGVPNRGLPTSNSGDDPDQFVVALDYEQTVEQIKSADFPESGLEGDAGLAIHHEAGLFLHMLNHQTDDLDIARLATVPHGDSVLALGKSSVLNSVPVIQKLDGLPIGGPTDLQSGYLAPYKHFKDNLFEGLFDPTSPNDLLTAANANIVINRTTELSFDTTLQSGGISNIPFVVRQANAAEMKSTFWIQEVEGEDAEGRPKLRLQYSQVVLLDFFPRQDGIPGLIRWPHVSINTLEKIS